MIFFYTYSFSFVSYKWLQNWKIVNSLYILLFLLCSIYFFYLLIIFQLCSSSNMKVKNICFARLKNKFISFTPIDLIQLVILYLS